jgi:hypothetical protein
MWILGEFWVDFGDGSEPEYFGCEQIKQDSDACLKMTEPKHMYTKPGTYIAILKAYTDGSTSTEGYRVIEVK